MKKGDKLYCIRSIKGLRKDANNILYSKNNIYIIKDYYGSKYKEYTQIYIINNFGETGSAFYLSYLNKYFITMQESRKLKLQKLNNL